MFRSVLSRTLRAARGSAAGAPAMWRLVPVFLISTLIAPTACEKEAEGPNVLLIIIDTLRPDYLGCYGSGLSKTPNVDRLAAGGVRFDLCVTTAPVTLPSVTGILSSSYPPYHGVRDNALFKVDPSLDTIAEVFRDEGYSTAAVVGAYVLAEVTGIDQGFDYFDSDFSGNYKDESSLLPERADEVSRTQRRAAEVTELAVKWLQECDSPFFLTVHYFDPHGPYDPPPLYMQRHPENKYLGEVEYTDENLGPLIEAAEAAAGEEDLIIALVADHGEGLGMHSEDTHGFFIYDSTVLVPFIVYYPGVVPPGIATPKQVSTVDVAPTLLDLAGLPAPSSWQGLSQGPLIALRPMDESLPGSSRTLLEARPCYVETYRTRHTYNWSELVGLRHSGWKLVRAPRPELYNVAKDMSEEENLYELRPDIVAQMDAVLDSLIQAHSGPLSEQGPIEDIDQETVDKLEALGYVMPSGKPPSGPLPDPKDEIAGVNSRFNSRDIVKKARRMINEGDLEGAEEALKKALELDPRNAVAYHDLGIVYYNQGDLERAVPLIEEAARLSPTSHIPRQHLGGIYLEMERYQDALTVLETAAVLSPDNVDVLMGYGTALQKTNDVKRALQQYQKVIELDPKMCLAYYRAAFMLARLGRYEEAAATLEAMFTKDPPEDLAAEARKFLAEIEARLPGRR